MDQIPLSISAKSYALLNPRLHDGFLLGIHLQGKNVELSVAEEGGAKYRILLIGVSHFRAADFWEGNIILDFTIQRGEAVPDAILEELVDADPQGQRPEKYVTLIRDKVVQDALYVVEMRPSYGCYLVAAAKDIQVFRDDEVSDR